MVLAALTNRGPLGFIFTQTMMVSAVRPRTDHGMVAAVHLHLLVDPLRRPTQGQFPQGNQIPLAEEILERMLRLLRHVDLAVFEALEEVVGGKVDQLDIIGLFEHRVRHRFTHPNTGDLSHHIVQTLHVLHVDGRIDVDARLQEFHDVLPSLRVSRTLGIGVGQFVHQNELRTTGECRVKIEFPQCRSAMLDHAWRQNRQPFQQGFRFRTTVRFDPPDDDIHPVTSLLVRSPQHRVGFPHARRGAEKDLELAARLLGLFSLHAPQQGIGIGSSFFHQMCAIGDTEFSPDWNVRY